MADSGVPPTAAPGRVALTRSGHGVLATALTMVAAGWAVGYREPVVFGLAGVLAVIAAVAWTLTPPGITASRRLAPAHTTRGGHTTATVTLRRTGRWARRGLRLADSCGDVSVDVPAPTPGARQAVTARYVVPTPRRGRLAVGPLRLVLTDPFGFCRRTDVFGDADTLVVRPRTVPLGAPASGRDAHLDGTTSDAVEGAPSAFHALRPYVPGDDQRLVHWRSTARAGTLIVRQLADLNRPHTTVVLDTEPAHYRDLPSGSGGAGDTDPADSPFELAVDVAASVACGAAQLAFPVRLVADGTWLAVGGDGGTGAILDALAVVRPGAAGSLGHALGMLGRARTGGSLVVVTGGGADGAVLRRIGALRQVFPRIRVLRVGGRAPGLPPAPRPAYGPMVVDVAALPELPGAWNRGAGR
ncbi:DUF58 domain-containing protein [Yinghuangia sp. ASG 101]|uniref:DUF58 domain-containing protein n=1 Tax=Yinghuangia sp. ASG 101 TaxID=2896848 RepID=UPI001E39C0FB|nr:DUF58 domain-containing protein [Yinghuangia sp. ASG 101]UGQ09031.1 DUF58 domain-containing protein [Yinghuangia sp. ASG 101]